MGTHFVTIDLDRVDPEHDQDATTTQYADEGAHMTVRPGGTASYEPETALYRDG